ncbi:SusC/RagA family TonB-linked outer membrane protein [Lutibacter sp.]|uniref:SusC/RagA family TonB-linked outer membrane protein n=1 Tax=Lutibacter sp. TaxID=1925666 RepID=UPI00356129F8
MKTKFNGFLMLLLALMVQISFAQEKTVTGKVSDASGPLPGVTVIIKGTKTGTQTDFDGNYSIKAKVGAVLQFSFMGMSTTVQTVGTSNTINVVMKEDAEALEEVVVTALGIQREKREVTYQTQKVSDESLTAANPTRAASALAGKVAGLQINVQDNGVNPSSQIILRGLRSVSGNNSALIVIDGSVSTQGAFDDLNPLDIETISVLKGATAAALYGSNAANGALIVTTKKGKSGNKLIVGINTSYTAETVAYMPEFQSEYGTGWEGAYDAVENTNWGPRFDGTIRQIGPTFPSDYGLETQMVAYAPIKNNLLDFFQTGETFNNTLYLSGSNEDSSFYVSFGDQRSNGIVPDDSYTRNTFRVNASKKINDITLTASTSFFTDETDVVGSTIGDQDRPLYWFILNTATNIPLTSYKDWQNPLSYGYADNYFNAYYQNPYWAIGTNRNIDESNRFVGNINLSWDIEEWLNFTGRISANNAWGSGKNWRAAQTYNADLQPAAGAVSSFVEDSEFQSSIYNADALLSGNFDIADDFTLKAIVGANVYRSKYRTSLIRANNLSIPDFYDISNGTGTPETTADGYEKRNYGFFADLTFGYNNYLFLNLAGRNDWTSTLNPDNNSYFYPSVGVSFVFTDAIEALQNNDILSYGKITFSNSTVYSDLDPYRINEAYFQSDGFPYGSINGFELTNTSIDANIAKEKINTNEIGLNLGFFRNRITLDASYFNTITSDLITFTTPSVASGSTSFLTNIGELEGNGIELTLGATVLKSNDFSWDVNVNYSSSETVVNKIKDGLDEIAISTTGQYGIYAVVGEAFPQIKANVYQYDPDGRVIVDGVSGHPLVETELKSLGKTTPDYILGVNSVITYKGLTLSGTLDYRTGHVYYEQGSDAMEFTGRSVASVSSNRQDFVIPNSVIETSPGVYVENTNVQVSGGRQSYWTDVYNDVKSNYVKDATALKLREVALSYSLPEAFLTKTKLSKVTFGLIGRNLFTKLPEENRFSDPEFNNTNSNAIGIGGYFQSPPTKSFGFNVNVEF